VDGGVELAVVAGEAGLADRRDLGLEGGAGAREGVSQDKLSGRGRAAILEANGMTFQKTAVTGSTSTGVPLRSKLRLRVVPDDGLPEFESSATVWGGDQGHFDALHWTYVRYDPSHPERCEVDSARLQEEFGPVDGRKRRNTVPAPVSSEWTRQASTTSRRPEP
jgi:hypothetical protein